MGWVIRCDDNNLDICTDIEIKSDDATVGPHPYREALKIPIGCINRIGIIKKPKWVNVINKVKE